MLIFGWVSDHLSRKIGMIVATIILIIFSALAAGSYGAGGSIGGLLAALTAYRFLLGIGIGGEYPAGSVACSVCDHCMIGMACAYVDCYSGSHW